MYFKTFTDKNLAHFSYLVGCQRTNEAVIIDPSRKIDHYIETAEEEGFEIIAVAETHIHADYLSGARELAHHVGAKLYVSDEGDANWKYEYVDDFDHQLLKDGDVFSIGNVDFEVMHTPGHTPESISFVLTDRGGGSTEPMGIFTGDFVFVGDIGRPDLLEVAAGVKGTADSGAREMFTSVQKFKELADHLQVWPGHGAGSACGKSLGAVPMSTVGYEKANNWALNTPDKDLFIKILLADQPEPPKYFAEMKKLNKIGQDLVNHEETKQLQHVDDLDKYGKETVMVDVRHESEFSVGHYEGAINIPLRPSFTNWAGWLIEYDQDIVLIAHKEDMKAIKTALFSIGLDSIVAFIEPETTLTNKSKVGSYEEIDTKQLHDQLQDDGNYLIDVRNQAEWEAGRVEGAHHFMLGTLKDHLEDIPKDKTLLVQCQSGGRSAIGASLLKAHGFPNVKNAVGGYLGWAKEKHPIVK